MGSSRKALTSATFEATTINEKVYGFPLSYYPWGFFYSKSLFKEIGIGVPHTWDEFLVGCEKIKAQHVAPLAVGAKEGWPAAAWFDYFDLRINGIEFHRRLLDGDEKFSDPRVRKVFVEWSNLLKNGYFLPATMNDDWDNVLPYIYRKRVAMALLGAFAATKIPPQISPDIGFFRFPQFSPVMPNYEEAPLDILVLPAHGENHRAARRFLSYLVDSGALAELNSAEHTVSPQAAKAGENSAFGSCHIDRRAKDYIFFRSRCQELDCATGIRRLQRISATPT